MNEHKNHDQKDKPHEEHKAGEHQHNHPAAEKKEEKKHDPLKEKDLKIAEMTDKYLRALAELENYRKRVSKDKEDFVKYTRGDTARLILPVLDNLDRAVHATKITDNIESLRAGVELVLKQLEDALRDLGVKEIATKGIFNPEFHHALHQETRSDRPEGEIMEVYQKGYLVDDKVIRPALVKVASREEIRPKSEGPGPKDEKQTQDTGPKTQAEKQTRDPKPGDEKQTQGTVPGEQKEDSKSQIPDSGENKQS
jgi:molecular chaperone GrpE